MALQIEETSTAQTWTYEIEDGGETHELVFEYRYPDPDDRYRYMQTGPDPESDADDPAAAYQAALGLCLACLVDVDGLRGPDGEVVEWQDDEKIAAQFETDTGDEARRFILQHLGGSYAESDGVVFRFSQHLLKVDQMPDGDQKKSDASSSAA